jgi:hypothetical protein
MYRTDENSAPFFLLFLVISFAVYIYRSKPFVGPAAVGLGLASLSVILVLCVYAVSYFDDLEGFSARGIAFYPCAGLLSVIVSLLLAGYSASKTWEDTVTMNVKIVMGVGFIPFIFISLISFSNISLWFVLAYFIVYWPVIWVGHLLFKYHNTGYASGHENS